MVTNHLRAPYGVYFTKNRTILRRPYGARPAAWRIVRFFYQVLDIVRCPVKFRYYLKFHGARTAFGRVNEGKMTSDGHRTVPGRRPVGVCTHRTGTGRFLCKIYIVGFQRCPVGHRTMSDKRRELWKISLQIGRCPSGHRTMPVRSPADVLWVELPPVRSDVFLQKNILHLHRYFISKDQKH